MIGQPEVIVAGQVDDLAPIHERYRLAGRFQNAQALVSAGLAPGL